MWRVWFIQGSSVSGLDIGASEKRRRRSSSGVGINLYLMKISYNLLGIDSGMRCKQCLIIRIVYRQRYGEGCLGGPRRHLYLQSCKKKFLVGN